jgi:hypothetical protein
MATLRDRLRAVAVAAVDRLFVRAKVRAGVVRTPTGDKRLMVSTGPVTLPGLFELTSREHGTAPRPGALEDVRRAAAGYLDAQAAAVKAAAGRLVGQIVSGEGLMTPKQKKELVGALDRLLTRATAAVDRIVNTEATAVRNLAGLDAIAAMATHGGVDDPNVFWVIVRDGKVCKECVRLHTVDGSRPRVWKLSEVAKTYHERGQNFPSIFGLHPHCRCTQTYLAPGYGFDSDGFVKFVGIHHDEHKAQRGVVTY